MNFAWERLGDGVYRCRLPFLDVTVGLVHGRAATLLIDTGTTLAEANAVKSDVVQITGGPVSHIVLTHNHFDHILGIFGFRGCAGVLRTRRGGNHRQRGRTPASRRDAPCSRARRGGACYRGAADTRAHGPSRQIDLGDRTATIAHPGRGHTDHDLIVIVAAPAPAVVFCGDLVEESGDPVIDQRSDLAAWPATLARVLDAGGSDAVFVPGHVAAVDAAFVERQRWWPINQV